MISDYILFSILILCSHVIGKETGVLNLYVSSNIIRCNIFGDVKTQPKYEVKTGIVLSQEMNKNKLKETK